MTRGRTFYYNNLLIVMSDKKKTSTFPSSPSNSRIQSVIFEGSSPQIMESRIYDCKDDSRDPYNILLPNLISIHHKKQADKDKDLDELAKQLID